MTNGIRADISSETGTVHLTSYPPQNPNFYHSYQYPYTPFPNPDSYLSYQYLPTPAPPYTYHSPQPPPQPSYQLYTTTHIPDTSTHLSFTDGLSGYFTYQAEFQPPLTSHSYNTQPISSGYMSSTITAQHYQQEAIFVQQPNTYAPQMFDEIPDSHMPISNVIIDNRHKIEEKLTEMLHTLEKMGKIYADLPKLVEKKWVGNVDREGGKDSQSRELSTNQVNQSSSTPTPVLVVDSLADLCKVEKIVNDGSKDLKQVKVSQPAIYAPHMFDEIPEKLYGVQIPAFPLHAPTSVIFHVESTERDLTPLLCNKHSKNDKKMVYNLHENEHGKFFGKFGVNVKNNVNGTQVFDGDNCELLIKGFHNDEKLNLVKELVDVGKKFLCLDGDKMCYKKLHENEYGKLEISTESSKYGPLIESDTEVLKKSNCTKVVFKRRDDAETASSSPGKFRSFGLLLISYRLNYSPSPRTPSNPGRKCKMKDVTTVKGKEQTIQGEGMLRSDDAEKHMLRKLSKQLNAKIGLGITRTHYVGKSDQYLGP